VRYDEEHRQRKKNKEEIRRERRNLGDEMHRSLIRGVKQPRGEKPQLFQDCNTQGIKRRDFKEMG